MSVPEMNSKFSSDDSGSGPRNVTQGHAHYEGPDGENNRDHIGRRHSPVKLSPNWKSLEHNPIYYIVNTY
jgi:hypothetical protein